MLIDNLPPESMLVRARTPEDRRDWDQASILAAASVNELRWLNAVLTTAPGNKVSAPTLIKLPSATAAARIDPVRAKRAIDRLERRTRRRIPDAVRAVMIGGAGNT